ncbi:MAG TPA: SpoIIE family protein phosphatase [Nocardioides sp.]|nr:SpoIIE family protein phosphatase [Nocardioides sp.]
MKPPEKKRWGRRRAVRAVERVSTDGPASPSALEPSPVDIAPGDPLLAYLQSAGGAVDIDNLELDSPAVRELRAAGVKLAVPLVSQGELIGVLNLGARLSEQEYSSDDRRLLDNLAGQAAPALRVGQLVREQEAEAATRQRYEQELEVARLIQSHFLPKQLPELPGWRIASFYRPAREVGGDFYDVIPLPDGRLGFVVGDVTDKGVPAALVMSATRSLLRAAAQRLVQPGEVLERVNEQLCPDMPDKMFVTCLYGVLDPATGYLRFANAGHDVPYVSTATGIQELKARGMPLGLMAGMAYEERDITLAPGDRVLLHSDGIAEAHDAEREMFGFPRLARTMAEAPADADLIQFVLDALESFTGPHKEQEDDITMVSLERTRDDARGDEPEVVAHFQLESRPGNERTAITHVAEALDGLTGVRLTPARLENLKTAVGEATMNAMEHGNQYAADVPVDITVLRDATSVRVRVTDRGELVDLPTPETPDLDAKLEGRQTARGWGMFLIEKLVDETRVTGEGGGHTLELVVHLEGDRDGA